MFNAAKEKKPRQPFFTFNFKKPVQDFMKTGSSVYFIQKDINFYGTLLNQKVKVGI